MPSRLHRHNNTELTTTWLVDHLRGDPTTLGLEGEIIPQSIRTQPQGGAIQLGLGASTRRRYQVDIQLGVADKAQVSRLLESWALAKSQDPIYDHVAVIVAEDFPARLLRLLEQLHWLLPIVVLKLELLPDDDATPIHVRTLFRAPDNCSGTADGMPPTRRTHIPPGRRQRVIAVVHRVTELLRDLDPDF